METVGFHFEQPIWLWGLIFPLVLWWLPRAQLREDYYDRLQHYADKHLLPYLIIHNNEEGVKRRKAFLLWTMLWVMAVIAMAGPRWDYTDIDIFEPTTGVVILFDMSRSMSAQDVRPNRLARAKQEVKDFVEQAQNLKVGLIAFATVANVLSPITEDRWSLLRILPALSTDLVRLQGSRLSNALDKAQRLFLSQPSGNAKAIVLVSDGDFQEPNLSEQVRQFRQYGINLYVIGVGETQGVPVASPQGGWLVDQQGRRVISKLDKTGLELLAQAGGGIYVTASYRNDDVETILEHIKQNQPPSMVKKNPIRVWHERFYILVGLMMLLLLYRFRQVQRVRWRK